MAQIIADMEDAAFERQAEDAGEDAFASAVQDASLYLSFLNKQICRLLWFSPGGTIALLVW